MTIDAWILKQLPERQLLLKSLHDVIVSTDSTVDAKVGTMMRNEMILYNAPGTFKYGLASVKQHMSLHVLPIYGSPALHEKYRRLLPNAGFQKGCINFKSEAEMPIDIATALIRDCSTIDLLKIREEYLKSKKK
jgi:hypothetical protein